jgi:TPR repeat protein
MLLRYASLYYPEKLKISVDLRQKLEDQHEELTYSEIIEVLEVFQNVYEEAKEFYNKGKECNIFARKFAKEYKKKEANECNEQAVYYYYQSADLGNRDAMFKLSECYEKGYGVDKKDMKLAYEWLEAAAKAGHKGAMKKLEDY